MIEFELINPSDAYTFAAPNLLVAACAVFILGEGKYGAKPVDGSATEESVPIFIFGGHDEWLKQHGVEELDTYIKEHRVEIATCLDSFIIGSIHERRTMERVLAVILNLADRERARDKWHDERRGSMNNIGARAKHFAHRLRQLKPEATSARS